MGTALIGTAKNKNHKTVHRLCVCLGIPTALPWQSWVWPLVRCTEACRLGMSRIQCAQRCLCDQKRRNEKKGLLSEARSRNFCTRELLFWVSQFAMTVDSHVMHTLRSIPSRCRRGRYEKKRCVVCLCVLCTGVPRGSFLDVMKWGTFLQSLFFDVSQCAHFRSAWHCPPPSIVIWISATVSGNCIFPSESCIFFKKYTVYFIGNVIELQFVLFVYRKRTQAHNVHLRYASSQKDEDWERPKVSGRPLNSFLYI